MLVRDGNTKKWIPALFANEDLYTSSSYKYGVIGSDDIVYFRECILYNDKTKHLLGKVAEWKFEKKKASASSDDYM